VLVYKDVQVESEAKYALDGNKEIIIEESVK
jgi:hypothetical protein